MLINNDLENKPEDWTCPRCKKPVSYRWVMIGQPWVGIQGYWQKMDCPRHRVTMELVLAWSVLSLIFFTVLYAATH